MQHRAEGMCLVTGLLHPQIMPLHCRGEGTRGSFYVGVIASLIVSYRSASGESAPRFSVPVRSERRRRQNGTLWPSEESGSLWKSV